MPLITFLRQKFKHEAIISTSMFTHDISRVKAKNYLKINLEKPIIKNKKLRK